MESVTIILSDESVSVQIARKKIKNIYLRVHANGDVSVSAPFVASFRQIQDFIDSKKSWIEKQRTKYCSRQKSNADPNTVYFLGSAYRLSVAQGDKSSVWVEQDTVLMTLIDPGDAEQRNRVLNQWLKKQAETVFQTQMQEIFDAVFAFYSLTMPKLYLRKMKTLWGSCTPSKNKITLNILLIQYDLRCIQYVVLHELTHLLYLHHDHAFYSFLTAHMPDWKMRKAALNGSNIMH